MESTRARASGEQFSTLLEFMESHGDLARPQPGAQGRLRADRLWQEVWADWKSKTKKKALAIRRHASGTGGGPSSNLALTVLEARVLGIIGTLAVEGHSEIEEQGFNRPSTEPSQNMPESAQLDLDIGGEDGISQAEPSQASTSRRQLSMPPAPVRRSPSRLTSPLPPVPTTPPSTSTLAAPSPNSPVTSPHRRHIRARRRRAQTPFERATCEFVAVEQRRLQVEEMRERNNARMIEVEHERNNLLSRFLDAYLQNR